MPVARQDSSIKAFSRGRLSVLDDPRHISGAVEDSDDLEGLGLRPVNDEVGTHWPEQVGFCRQILTVVSGIGRHGKPVAGVLDLSNHPIGSVDVVTGNVFPDLVQILSGQRQEPDLAHLR